MIVAQEKVRCDARSTEEEQMVCKPEASVDLPNLRGKSS